MAFELPAYTEPDFDALGLNDAPDAAFVGVEADGVAPKGFHATSMYPEYLRIDGAWRLVPETRMDCCVVLRDGALDVVEGRYLRVGDLVALGRSEDGTEGIYLHDAGFAPDTEADEARFSFRQGRSRETSFARDYDRLVELLRHERDHGFVVWVLGPAVSFDHDARRAMQSLVEAGYVDGMLAGNALATHDLEGAWLHTALGQDIYTQRPHRLGHYNHLDVINEVRRAGSIEAFARGPHVHDGIMYALVNNGVPYVLAGSIRDDGPLPEVFGDAYEAQVAMRGLTSRATTIICLATMLHTIATGNLVPSYRVTEDGTVRPLYFYAVDADEFVLNKLHDRGSLSATTIVANVQDFVTLVARGLQTMD